jgi:Xaa-Pro aminopeptidase
MNYQRRLDRLREKMSEVNTFYVDDPINLYYLTGLQLSAGKLLITAEEATLLVDGRYIELASQAEGPFEVELAGDKWRDQLKGPVGFDSHLLCYEVAKGLDRGFPSLLMELRAIKEPEEIELLRRAGALCSRGYDHAASLLTEGISELEVARQLEIFWLEEGGEKLSFDPIIAFGSNSSRPHHHTSARRLKEGEPVLFDMGVQLESYQSDMTRVRFFGTPDPEMEKIYAIVKEAFEAARDLCRPGVTAGELDGAARDRITDAGYGKQFSHSLGHGVGLDVHELPILRGAPPQAEKQLEEGMVITIEPGIYLPELGGVRLEDTFVVTADGCESLTCRAM